MSDFSARFAVTWHPDDVEMNFADVPMTDRFQPSHREFHHFEGLSTLAIVFLKTGWQQSVEGMRVFSVMKFKICR
jgi:hypothetical protein